MIHPAPGYCLMEQIPKTQGTEAFVVSTRETDSQLQETSLVVSVGKDLTTDAGAIITSPCVPGQKVVHKSWSFDQWTYQGKNYRLVRFQDITATIEE